MDTGIVQIHGKDYQTVALRVSKLRDDHPDWTISTDILSNADTVLIKACILDENGRLIGSGHAEEIRGSTNINKTSAVENCETSAIGRALAASGYGGTEYASANEMEKMKEYISTEQVKELMDLAGRAEADIDKFLKYCCAETFETITIGKYSSAVSALKTKIEKNNAN